MEYSGVKLHNSITVGKIFSIHYFEYMNNFKFSGEAHNFWELVYIDKGEAGITHNKSYTVLHKGELFFHKPNEFHSVRATGTIAPNLIVISFECNDKAMNFFNNRRMKIDETAQTLLANIIIEAKRCFNCRLDDPYLQNMPLKDTDIFGSQQMIRLYLEHFLIHLIRCYSQSFLQHKKLSEAKLPKATKINNDTETFNKIIDYLNRHITSHVTIDLICKDNLIGRSQLQKLFKEQCNRGIIEYFSILKIEAAKELIRTNHMNFTQISAHLGYTSIHYFQAIQKNCRNDTFRIRFFCQSNSRRKRKLIVFYDCYLICMKFIAERKYLLSSIQFMIQDLPEILDTVFSFSYIINHNSFFTVQQFIRFFKPSCLHKPQCIIILHPPDGFHTFIHNSILL